MEDKRLICEKLAEVLRLTRAFDDLSSLEYEKLDNGDEIVKAQFVNGAIKTINVTADSGITMIIDITKYIM